MHIDENVFTLKSIWIKDIKNMNNIPRKLNNKTLY